MSERTKKIMALLEKNKKEEPDIDNESLGIFTIDENGLLTQTDDVAADSTHNPIIMLSSSTLPIVNILGDSSISQIDYSIEEDTIEDLNCADGLIQEINFLLDQDNVFITNSEENKNTENTTKEGIDARNDNDQDLEDQLENLDIEDKIKGKNNTEEQNEFEEDTGPQNYVQEKEIIGEANEIEGHENNNGTNMNNEPKPQLKRKKRHQVKEDEWQCKKSKILREKGKQYKGRKEVNGKCAFNTDKKKREIKPVTCKCKNPIFKCRSISEQLRLTTFNKFWNMTWKEKKMLVASQTEICKTERARDRKNVDSSRRSVSIKFYLEHENTKLRVCRNTFCNTYDLNGWTVNYWLKEKKYSCIAHEENTDNENGYSNNENTDDEHAQNQAECGPKSKSRRQDNLNIRHENLKAFFFSLPKVESHYCRKSSSKLYYVEPTWKTKRELYTLYSTNWCLHKQVQPLSTCTFHKIFEDLNLALYQPKKDQCDTCRAFSLNHVDIDVYNAHIKKKNDAQKEKENDKTENGLSVVTIDLQSLLLSPKSNASALYYRRKLAVHNMCIFDLKTKNGYCYLWNESEGKLTANEFSSILCDFIESQVIPKGERRIVIYSDGCTYQNRSSILANALLHLAAKHNICIEQKYLEKGHTYMECDSMHSVIERHLRKRDINVPADYITICKNARQQKPYEVKYLEHTFFKDFTHALVYNSIRPGEKAGDPKVTDIRSLKYTTDGKIYYKLNYDDAYKDLPNLMLDEQNKRKSSRRLLKSKNKGDEPSVPVGQYQFPALYQSRLKITKDKFQHLQELKQSVPKDFHSFYDSLPYDSKTLEPKEVHGSQVLLESSKKPKNKKKK